MTTKQSKREKLLKAGIKRRWVDSQNEDLFAVSEVKQNVWQMENS
jgi:hypothetical protein